MNVEQLLERNLTQLGEDMDKECSSTSENGKVIEDERDDSDNAKIIHVDSDKD